MTAPVLEGLRAARLHQQRTAPDVDTLVRESVGLHSTDYLSPYLSARARLAAFDPANLFDRLNTGDGLVRVNAMRNTVHVVHTEDLPMLLAACGPAVAAVGRKSPGLKGLSDDGIAAGLAAFRDVLTEGPLATNALKARLPNLASELRSWLLVAMGAGDVVRADAAHPRSNRTRYALTSRWIPSFRPWEGTASEARRDLLLRAVRGFGPLTAADLAWWLPAPKGEVARVLASGGPNLRQVAVDGETYWYTSDLADRPAPPRDTHAAWALPYEDGLLKAYFDRSWCLAPGMRAVLFPYNVAHWAPPDGRDPGPGPHGGVNTSGEARPSIWWGGRAVGRWEQRDAGVVWQVHADIGAEGREAVEQELAEVARFLNTALDQGANAPASAEPGRAAPPW